MAVSSVRFGPGVTREVGMDLADMRVRHTLVITDPVVRKLAPDAQAKFVKAITAALEKEGIAYDIDAYRDAPSGLRIWCGATVERADVEALTLWLDWAYAQAKEALPKAA